MSKKKGDATWPRIALLLRRSELHQGHAPNTRAKIVSTCLVW